MPRPRASSCASWRVGAAFTHDILERETWPDFCARRALDAATGEPLLPSAILPSGLAEGGRFATSEW